MKYGLLTLVSGCALVAAFGIYASGSHNAASSDQAVSGDMLIDMSHDYSGVKATEAGQAAFGSIAEIVTLLENDPDTDWSMVNIDALREHLVDMNNLTLNATVKKERKGNAITFFVIGTGQTLGAIQRMVPEHAKMLSMSSDYAVSARKGDSGAVLTISSEDQAILAKVEALGFFGLMATGSHHPIHHLGVANGTMAGH